MFSIIKQTLITAKEDLSNDAKQIEKEFWDHHHEINNRLGWSEKGKIGLRVRIRERGEIPSLDIEWFKMYFIKDKEGKYTMRSTYIKGALIQLSHLKRSPRTGRFLLLRKPNGSFRLYVSALLISENYQLCMGT